MKIEHVLKHFKTQVALSKAIGVTQPCISAWVKAGRIPEHQQIRIHYLTGGALKVGKSVLAPKVSRS